MDDKEKFANHESIDNKPQDATARRSSEEWRSEADHLWFIKARHAIYYVLGVIEVLLVLRLLFKLLGASTGSGFVDLLYMVSGALVLPFDGIFRTFITHGDSVRFVLEPATLVAMAIYAVIARGLVSLARLKVIGDSGR